MPLSLQSTLALPKSSVKIPALGFGVYKSHGDTCIKSVTTALEAGYRHVDTAQYYGNESQVGQAVKSSGLKRSDVFITTKVMSPSKTDDETYKSCLDSVQKIDQDGYVDLFLIHSPSSGPQGRKTMWKALEKLHSEGKAKSIGVSNFGIAQIEALKADATVWPPHVNQIELHPWLQQREIVKYCHDHGIVVEAYCPIARNQKADDPTLNELAKKYNKSTGQILIRYCLQKNWVPLPKSDTPSRIKGNVDVFDFDISEADMAKLDSREDEDGTTPCVMAVDNDAA